MASTYKSQPTGHKGFMWLHKPRVVFSAELDYSQVVAHGFSGSTEILERLFFDTVFVGETADIKEGMTVCIGSTPGAHDLGFVRVRGTTVYEAETVILVWCSVHIPEAGVLQYSPVYQNYVTVLDDFRVWMLPPFINGASGYWDGTNGAGGTTYHQLPVANAGPMQVKYADTNGLAEFDLSGAGSYAVALDAYLGGLTACSLSSPASSSENGANTDDKAFDGNPGTYWEATSNADEWLAWSTSNIGTQTNPAEYLRAIHITCDAANNAPDELRIKLWANGEYIDVLHETGLSWTVGETKTFYLDFYRGRITYTGTSIIRLYIDSTQGAGNVRIREVTCDYEDRASSPYEWDVGDCTITTGSTTTEDITVGASVGFRYIELTVTDSNSIEGKTYVPILVLTKTPIVDDSYTEKVSSFGESSYAPGYQSWKVLDGDTDTAWRTTATTGWIQFNSTLYLYGAPMAGYRMYAKGTSAPKDWTWEGSHDGSTWYVLSTHTGVVFDAGGEWYEVEIDYQVQYKYYRWDITLNGGHGTYLEIFELIPTVDQTYLAPHLDFEVVKQTLSMDGQEISLNLLETIDPADYMSGCLMVYGEQEWADGTEDYAGKGMVRCWGWHDPSSEQLGSSYKGLITGAQLRILDVAHRLASLPAFPFVIERDNSGSLPAYYNLMEGATLDRLFYLIMRWLGNAVHVTDVIWSYTGAFYAFSVLQATSRNIWDMAKSRISRGGFKLVGETDNTLRMSYDQRLETIIPGSPSYKLGEDDIVDISYELNPLPEAHWAWAAGVERSVEEPSTAINAFRAVAPGNAPGQGLSSAEYNEVLVIDQDELNTRTGARYALANSRISILKCEIMWSACWGTIYPGRFIGFEFTTPRYAELKTDLEDRFYTILKIDIRHHEGGAKTWVLHLEEWADGVPAHTIT